MTPLRARRGRNVRPLRRAPNYGASKLNPIVSAIRGHGRPLTPWLKGTQGFGRGPDLVSLFLTNQCGLLGFPLFSQRLQRFGTLRQMC